MLKRLASSLIVAATLLPGTAKAHLTCDMMMQVLSFTLSSNFGPRGFTPETSQLLLNNFIRHLDGQRFFLLENDVSGFREQTANTFGNITQGLLRLEDMTAMARLQTRYTEGMQETADFLLNLKDRRRIVIQRAQSYDDESLATFARSLSIAMTMEKETMDFPKTADEKHERILDFYALWFKWMERAGLNQNDAFVAATRQISLLFKKAKWTQLETLPSLVLKSIVQSLDPHSDYLTTEEGEMMRRRLVDGIVGIGITHLPSASGLLLMQVISGGVADQAGLKAGDIITHLDNKLVVGLHEGGIAEIMGKGDGKNLEVKFKREGKRMRVALRTERVHTADYKLKGKTITVDGTTIGTISFPDFYRGATQDLKHEIKRQTALGAQGFILDLRNNGGGLLDEAIPITGLFVEKGAGVYTMYPHQVSGALIPPNNATFKHPLVVIVNSYSASAAELLASNLKEYGRAIIVGDDQTFGKGSVQMAFPVAFRDSRLVHPYEVKADDSLEGTLKVTQALYFDGTGRTPQLAGVKSDVVFPMSSQPRPHERDFPNALPSTQRLPVEITGQEASIPNRDQVVETLNEKSRRRIEAAQALWQEYLKGKGSEDLYMDEASRILTDLIALTRPH